MTTYADVKKQIAQLEKKAADLRKVEVAKAVANIREQMAEYELTVDDVAPVKSTAKGKVAARKTKVKVGKPAKYMDPKTGKTWTGHGKAPAWIAAATKKGRRDDFLIEKVTQAKDAKPAEKAAPKAPVTASKSTGTAKKAVTKKVVRKKPKAVAKKTPLVTKAAPARATKVKAAAPAKKAGKKAPANAAAKPTTKSAGVATAPKKLASKPAATKPQTSVATPPAAP